MTDKEDTSQSAPARAFIQAISPSPLDANLIWVGTSSGLIQVTHDGATWTDVSPAGLPERSTVNSIDASPHDPNAAFAAILPGATTIRIIFRTRDGGKTWDKIVNGLPEAGIARVVREDPVRKGMLFAGTETGVYVSFDLGITGSRYSSPCPQVPFGISPFTEMIWLPPRLGADSGYWTTSLRSASSSRPPEIARPFFHSRRRRFAFIGTIIPIRLTTRYPASQNPPDGAILYYALGSAPKGEITLDVLDSKGTRIRHFSSLPAKETLPPRKRSGILVLSSRHASCRSRNQSVRLGFALPASHRPALRIFWRASRVHRIHAAGPRCPRADTPLPAAGTRGASRDL